MTDIEMTKGKQAEKIGRILSGSCTPACDLLALVESGEISREQANNALQGRMGPHPSLANVAQAERAERLRLLAAFHAR